MEPIVSHLVGVPDDGGEKRKKKFFTCPMQESEFIFVAANF